MKKQLFALFFSALILLSSVLGSGAVMVSAGRTTFAADTPATTGDIEEGDNTSSSDLSLREGDWEYVITGESVWIIGYYGNDPVIELPQTLGGKPVIGVESMALPQESDFVVPETITNLFFYSFSGKKQSIHAKEGSVAAAYANSHANIAYSEVHLFSDTVTAPTCTEQGYTTHTCPCGQVVVDSFVPPTGHLSVTAPALLPTCTKTGLTEGAECAVCGEIIIAQNTVPAKGHTFENGTCTVCGIRDTSVNPFTDVKKSAWYYSYVMDTYAKGLFEGFSDNTFHPDENMSRAQIVVVLHRLSGSPAPAAKSPFTDA